MVVYLAIYCIYCIYCIWQYIVYIVFHCIYAQEASRTLQRGTIRLWIHDATIHNNLWNICQKLEMESHLSLSVVKDNLGMQPESPFSGKLYRTNDQISSVNKSQGRESVDLKRPICQMQRIDLGRILIWTNYYKTAMTTTSI